MKALRRELYELAIRSDKEGGFSLTAAYRFVLKKRSHRGNANYKARKSQIRSHPVEIAVRYEIFDDDSMAADFRSWTAKRRWSLGGRYTIYGKDNVYFYAMGEFRHSAFRVPLALEDPRPETQEEIYVRLGVDF